MKAFNWKLFGKNLLEATINVGLAVLWFAILIALVDFLGSTFGETIALVTLVSYIVISIVVTYAIVVTISETESHDS
jgi:hypothetical protein